MPWNWVDTLKVLLIVGWTWIWYLIISSIEEPN